MAEGQPGIKFEIKMTNAEATLVDFFDLISEYSFPKIKAKFKVIRIDNKLSAMILHPTVSNQKEHSKTNESEAGN